MTEIKEGSSTKTSQSIPLELVGIGSSSSMDSFASWKMNGSGMEKGRERRHHFKEKMSLE